MRRSCASSYRRLQSVTFTIATSSISIGLITQPVTPGGTTSVFIATLLYNLIRLSSRSSPT